MRRLKIEKNFPTQADGSVLIEMGSTKVICTAMIEEGVPRFLMDSGTGWVTAEYNMLPASTTKRNPREGRRGGVKGRTYEIQRLIGRSLRSCINLDGLGQRTIYIDCDVVQADGGTRTAAVNGGFAALYLACRNLVRKKVIRTDPINFYIGAVSVGIVNKKILVDLDYEHDRSADVDMNIVMDEFGRLIEVQGTAEGEPFTRTRLSRMITEAHKAIQDIIKKQKKVLDIT